MGSRTLVPNITLPPCFGGLRGEDNQCSKINSKGSPNMSSSRSLEKACIQSDSYGCGYEQQLLYNSRQPWLSWPQRSFERKDCHRMSHNHYLPEAFGAFGAQKRVLISIVMEPSLCEHTSCRRHGVHTAPNQKRSMR